MLKCRLNRATWVEPAGRMRPTGQIGQVSQLWNVDINDRRAFRTVSLIRQYRQDRQGWQAERETER